MRLKYSSVVKFIALVWAALMLILVFYFNINYKPSSELKAVELSRAIDRIAKKLDNYSSKYDSLLEKVRSLQKLSSAQEILAQPFSPPSSDRKANVKTEENPIIPVIVIACNREQAVTRSLIQLLRYRPSEQLFPIIVSQDCGHEPTTKAILKFRPRVNLIKQPDHSPIQVPFKEGKFSGYFKIARHYKWALDTVFGKGYDAVIIVEDDLDVSPDIFSYFAATYPLLRSDPTLYCVSAWNDNGIETRVDAERGATTLYRSDFFPGLGWMLTKELWTELSPKWPKSYWDDWIRAGDQRKDRSCIRPEISRTHTFGKIGVSNGLFFDKYLNKIFLNSKLVNFSTMDLSFLKKENYDSMFMAQVQESVEVSLAEFKTGRISDAVSYRIIYHDKEEFKKLAKIFDLMSDFKDGVPRTSYLGVVTFFYFGKRVYLVPVPGWSGYDPSWT